MANSSKIYSLSMTCHNRNKWQDLIPELRQLFLNGLKQLKVTPVGVVPVTLHGGCICEGFLRFYCVYHGSNGTFTVEVDTLGIEERESTESAKP